MKKLLLFSLFIFLIVGCSSKQDKLIGSWVEPIPGQDGKYQGIKIEPNGKASSINMYTLVYEKWNIADNKLILKGKSIGNGQTLVFTDTLCVERVSKDSLILKDGKSNWRYSRQTANY